MSSLRESTLTTPSDRNISQQFKLDTTSEPLTNKQMESATKTLNTNLFPEVERRYTDPSIDLQKVGLFSFVPARGSTPNSQGIYGFAKFQDVLKTHETIINCLGENDTQPDTRKTILKDMGNVIAQMIADQSEIMTWLASNDKLIF